MAVAVSNVRVDKDVGGAASDEAALVNACRLQAPRAALEQVVGSSRQSITRKQRNFAALNVLMRRARAVMSITSLAEAIRAQYPDSFKSLLHVSADKHDEMQIRLAVREAVEACEVNRGDVWCFEVPHRGTCLWVCVSKSGVFDICGRAHDVCVGREGVGV